MWIVKGAVTLGLVCGTYNIWYWIKDGYKFTWAHMIRLGGMLYLLWYVLVLGGCKL